MAFKSLGKGMWKNIKAAHKVEGIGAAYLKRAGIGAGIGAVGGGIWESAEGGSFGDGMISGAAKGAALGAGTVLYKSAGLGSNIFREGTRKMNKGAFGNFGKMWRGQADDALSGAMAGAGTTTGATHVQGQMSFDDILSSNVASTKTTTGKGKARKIKRYSTKKTST